MTQDPLILNNPAAAVALTILRDVQSVPEAFRLATRRLSLILAVEAALHLPVRSRSVQTPLEETIGAEWDRDLWLVPILRAGSGLLPGFLEFFPHAAVAHLGIARNEQTLAAEWYLDKLPADLSDKSVIVLDPMLATGHSLVAALDRIVARQPEHIIATCILAAPEGLAEVRRRHPEVTLIVAAVDRALNDHGYIVPGLGDAGDRYFSGR